ncbi:hypothetical protein [Streptomyces sp. NBC_01637]|uniref:hypothetical protein n=1 Tax=unclassified Streptomyces TaxID=2593676 RepID=UPI00386EC819|nr:hypothetical protein OH719_05645 [Streptomyces sp. NBC_01653]WTD93422.1 hypothetical protein OG891_41215 [Streptomyces sp. NBC_01637]
MAQNERLADLKPVRQRQAAALALWRWRAPVLAFEMDADWGVDPHVLESLFRLATEPPGEQSNHAYGQAFAELCTAPIFESEVDPDTVQLFQLEIFGGLWAFGELLDKPGLDEVKRLVGLGQVRMGVGMLWWQVGQAPVHRARSVWSLRRTW